jgi:hypothetical protein
MLAEVLRLGHPNVNDAKLPPEELVRLRLVTREHSKDICTVKFCGS